MDLNQILVEALSQEASDVHIKVGTPPVFRINGVLKPWNKLKAFDTNDVSKIAFDLMNDWQKERFIKNREVDMGYEVYGLGRFRVNVFQQRGKMRIALRIVPYQIKSLGELHLPAVLKNICPGAARPHPGDRDDGKRQVDDPGLHDRYHQREPELSHHHR